MNRPGRRHARSCGLAEVTAPVRLHGLTVTAKGAVKLLALRAPPRRPRSRVRGQSREAEPDPALGARPPAAATLGPPGLAPAGTRPGRAHFVGGLATRP
jgi:hypothetical protein